MLGTTLPANEYENLFRDKCEKVLAQFAEFALPVVDRYPSPPVAFRFRAEFRLLRNADNTLTYAMHQPGQRKQLVPVTQFPIAATAIQRIMPRLLNALQSPELSSQVLTDKLFYVEFLASTLGEILVCLIYHRPLDEAWSQQARQLKNILQQDENAPLQIIGRSKGQKVCLEQDFIHEQFCVAATQYRYQQIEGSFTQPNAYINEKMLGWAATKTAASHGDLLELYCGNGNFTLPLSRNFAKVLATEVSKTSIQSAEYNLALNDIRNVAVVRLSSEETAQALNRDRPFRRLAHLDLDDYHFSTVLVDPPRAGLDAQTLQLVQQFDKLCYISCNPETLATNLKTLTETHVIKQFALFDQFPYTEHMECGVILRRHSTALCEGNDSVRSPSKVGGMP